MHEPPCHAESLHGRHHEVTGGEDVYKRQLRALVSTPGTEALLLAEAGKDDLTAARKQALAYAFAEKRLAAAEPFLLTWLEGADAQTAEQIYNALAACGSQASVKPLAAAAAKTGCAWNLSLIHI